MSCGHCGRCPRCYDAMAHEADMLDEVSAALCCKENLAAANARIDELEAAWRDRGDVIDSLVASENAVRERLAQAEALLKEARKWLIDPSCEVADRIDAYFVGRDVEGQG